MTITLRIELIIFALLSIIFILWTVKKEKLLIKYALLWILAGCLILVAVIIPNFIESIAKLLGFATPSNMIFLVAIIILLYISFSLTIVVSKQSSRIRLLIQELSLLKKKTKK